MSERHETAAIGRRRFRVPETQARIAAALAKLAQAELGKAGPEQALLEACVQVVSLWQQRDRLLAGPATGVGGAQMLADQPTQDAIDHTLDRICNARAVTLAGHRARAAVVLAQDEGQHLQLAKRPELIQERLVLALLVDLLDDATGSVIP